MLKVLAGCVLASGVLAGCTTAASPQHDAAQDSAAIEAALRQWPHDFNDRKLPEVCGLFAADVVLSYPDSPDRGHDAFCDRMAALFKDPARKFRYAEPDIKEILVDGDLATVRLFWTLTVTDTAGAALETKVEDGLDVFRRQPDGTWKIHVSHAFTKD
jgi:hypothetical protein